MEAQAYLDGMLDDVEATFQYTSPGTTEKALRDFLGNASDRDQNIYDHTILVTGFSFPPDTSPDIEVDNPPFLKGFKLLYFEDFKILIVTMSGLLHEEAASRLGALLNIKVNDMQCFEEIGITGRVRLELENIEKEPDGSWGPERYPYHPTCIVEVASSQSMRSLHNVAHLWLEKSASLVSQVITIKIYPGKRELIFGVWVMKSQAHNSKPLADMEQEVKVVWQGGKHGRPVAEKSLRISFQKIFKRKPRRGTPETDIIFSARELGSIARHVWQKLGLVDHE